MIWNIVRTIASIGLALLIVGCGAADDTGAEDTGPPDSQAPVTTTASPEPTTTTPSATTTRPTPTAAPTKPPTSTVVPPPGDFEPGDDPVAYAVADLAARLGTGEGEITLLLQEEVMWPDGSLGCPQPGMSYTQALVDGSRIVLEHDGTAYPYHSGYGRAPFLCEQEIE